MEKISLNFAKSCILSRLSKVEDEKGFHLVVFETVARKTESRVIYQVILYSVTKMIATCSLTIGQFFGTMIVASTYKEWFL